MTPDEQTVERVAFLRHLHEQVSFENGDHPKEIDTAYSAGADALERAAISAMPDTTQQSSGDDGNREPLMWAVEKWRDEVQNRPLHNVLRRTLDDTWRTVMRKFGGNPEELVGPSHDDLVATAAEATP